jgi:tetratricopeptide (TPR) repeat protein
MKDRPATHAITDAAQGYVHAVQEAHCPIMEVTPRISDAVRAAVIECLQGGQYTGAESLLRKAPETFQDPEALRFLAVALHRQGRAQERLEIHTLGERLAVARFKANEASYRIDDGDLIAGVEAARAALGLNPHIPHAWANLFYALSKQRDLAGLEAAFDDLEARWPDWRQQPHIVDSVQSDIILLIGRDTLLADRIKRRLLEKQP